MSFTSSSSNSPRRVFFWIFIAALVLLLLAAVGGVLGPTLVLLALLLIAVGLIAIVRGHFPMFGVSNRRTATGVLLFGVYFIVLGAITSVPAKENVPVAAAAGDTCTVTGAVHEGEEDTFYCVPSKSGDLVWGTDADFTAYQDEERKKLEEDADQEAQAIIEERDEELAAAEKRAEDAEAELREHKESAKAAEEARETEKAEDEAAAAEAEEEEQRRQEETAAAEEVEEEPQRQEEVPQNTPETPSNETSNSGVAFENCTAARDAGAAPVHRGDPGYGTHLDRDGDGVGCE